ncbi:MAG TPA: DUF2283 domain-containing protein [archaeon]|nr:DUF2283 domain-containing protein [archaeon]
MTNKFKADYDYENDNLYLYSEKNKSKGSVELGELVVDFTANGDIVGLEMFEASKYLSEITNRKLAKTALGKITSANISFMKKRGTTIIKIVLPLEKELHATIAIQNMNYKSPVMA